MVIFVCILVWVHCLGASRDACPFGGCEHDLVGGERTSTEETQRKDCAGEGIEHSVTDDDQSLLIIN